MTTGKLRRTFCPRRQMSSKNTNFGTRPASSTNHDFPSPCFLIHEMGRKISTHLKVCYED